MKEQKMLLLETKRKKLRGSAKEKKSIELEIITDSKSTIKVIIHYSVLLCLICSISIFFLPQINKKQ